MHAEALTKIHRRHSWNTGHTKSTVDRIAASKTSDTYWYYLEERLIAKRAGIVAAVEISFESLKPLSSIRFKFNIL